MQKNCAYYVGIMLNAFGNLLCPKLSRHNRRRPIQRFPTFDPNLIEMPDDVKERLQPTHWFFLVQTFGLTLG